MKKLTKKQKERLKVVGTWTGLGLLSYELYMAMVLRRQKTRDAFNLALQQKVATGKQLIVIGDPDGYASARILGRDYDCADLCIDARGCAKCPGDVVGGIPQALANVQSGSAIVFIGPGQLESTDDMEAALAAIERVAGKDVFASPVSPWTLASLFYKRRITASPPTRAFTEWRDFPWIPGPSVTRKHALPAG